MDTEEFVPITDLKPGSEGIVSCIDAGAKAAQRLTDLGLTPGTKVRVLRSARYGPVEICVRGSRLCIGRGIAGKVYVKVA
ncbi:MAG: ferrous iron transport protein A [Candidatus Altiarchaeota archaeon]|nr:ferrous iron transport protein A [Candidatus Altiarchaeota archaeon]